MSSTPSNARGLNSANGAACRIASNRRVGRPRLDGDHRDDLLREHVERVARIARRLDGALVHRRGDRRARDQVAAELREDDAGADAANLVARAPDALHAAGHRRRRLDLDHQIDRAHVDAQLQRGGRHQRAQPARLEGVLDLQPLRPRDGTVMRPHQRLAGQLVERRGQTLGQAAAVDEEQRRAVRANQLEQARVDAGPDRRAHRPLRGRAARDLNRLRDLRHVLDRHFHAQLERLGRPRVDDGDGTPGRRGRGRGELGVDVGLGFVDSRELASGAWRLLASADSRTIASGLTLSSRLRAFAPSRLSLSSSPRRCTPPRNRATSSSGRCVADRPMRCSGRLVICSRRSSDSARCAPRLVGTSAWISSTMTVSTLRSASRAREVSSRNSDSGVVIRMSVGSRWNLARSRAGVSPCGCSRSARRACRRARRQRARCRQSAPAGCARCRPPEP